MCFKKAAKADIGWFNDVSHGIGKVIIGKGAFHTAAMFCDVTSHELETIIWIAAILETVLRTEEESKIAGMQYTKALLKHMRESIEKEGIAYWSDDMIMAVPSVKKLPTYRFNTTESIVSYVIESRAHLFRDYGLLFELPAAEYDALHPLLSQKETVGLAALQKLKMIRITNRKSIRFAETY